MPTILSKPQNQSEQYVELEFEDGATALEKLIRLTHDIMNVDAPMSYVNPEFQTVLGSKEKVDNIAEECPLELPPEVEAMLLSPTPPSFKTFPRSAWPEKLNMGCLVVCLTKEGDLPRIYIGSGTNFKTAFCIVCSIFVQHAIK